MGGKRQMSEHINETPLLEVKHLRKLFPVKQTFRSGEKTFIKAVDDVSFTLNPKETLGVVGESGCGKSTYLKTLNRMNDLVSNVKIDGTVLLDGEDIYDPQVDTTLLRKKVGMVFQSFNLIDELNVYENVELPLIYLKKKASEKKEIVSHILDRMNISHRAKHFPQQLSGGQQQRVAIARAVVASPKLILADEPTGNLDSRNGTEVMNLLTELNQEGTTIIMVTHSQHDASYAHRVINLFDGQIVTETCGVKD